MLHRGQSKARFRDSAFYASFFIVLQYSSETVGFCSTRYSLTVQLRDSMFCFYASHGTVLQYSSEIIRFKLIKNGSTVVHSTVQRQRGLCY